MSGHSWRSGFGLVRRARQRLARTWFGRLHESFTMIRQIAQRLVDVDRAIAFYNDLLGQEPTAVFNPPGFVFYQLGQTRLLLEPFAPSAVIYLHVENVRERVEQLRTKGVKITTEPHVVFPDPEGIFDAPGDEWLAFVEDSEGNQVGLMSREKKNG